MKKNIILSNFRPIVLNKPIHQKQLNEYMKFLYAGFHKKPETSTFSDIENGRYRFVSEQVDKYSVGSKHINKRQIVLFESIAAFIENEAGKTNLKNYPVPIELRSVHQFGPKIEFRMKWFKEKTQSVLNTFYSDENQTIPENLIHVSCSGYASPSVAQELIVQKNWLDTQVTHSYQMGCYGAFPAIRTGKGLIAASEKNGRVDILHTELLSAHLNLTEFSISNTLICSLFADGFIGYSLYEENTFLNDASILDKKGLKIVASHEVIIPNSSEDMSWNLGEYNFLMTLSKRVPVFICENIKSFLTTLCEKAKIDFDKEKNNFHFAIHPGGPRIIDYIIDELKLAKDQAHWSYEVLRCNGNMSSATVPHVLNEIIKDSTIVRGTKIIAIAFGPGLTATALLLEKIG